MADPMKGVIPRAEVERRELDKNRCMNCGEDLRYKLKDGTPAKTGHFAPPCMGEPGFWTCEKAARLDWLGAQDKRLKLIVPTQADGGVCLTVYGETLENGATSHSPIGYALPTLREAIDATRREGA